MDEALEREKDLAARAAARRAKSGMRIALGTGTTAAYAVRALAERFPKTGAVTTVASSMGTERLARELGLEVGPLREGDRFDLMFDGADEVTPTLALTKGGGGALLREKLLARRTKEMLVLVDHTKLVGQLGERSAIPIEIVPWARPIVLEELKQRRIAVTLRTAPGGAAAWLSDNGNEILDLRPPETLSDPAALDASLKAIPGVIETGIFVGLASLVYVGLPDGTVQEIHLAAPKAA